MITRTSLVTVALMAMAGCGGGSDSADHGQTRPPATYGDIAAQSAALQTQWAGVAASDPATLPMTGQATYSGAIHLDLQVGATPVALNGALDLTARFATSAIAGTASGFVDPSDAAFAGSLVLSNGYIDRTVDPAVSHTFGADLQGTLRRAGDYQINAVLVGDFLGAGQGAVVGPVGGLVTGPSGSGPVSGDFIAGR